MKTPAGTECKYFYGDYYRGRDLEECRLLGAVWTRDLCRTCPVPSIGMANACEFMQLRGEVIRPLAASIPKITWLSWRKVGFSKRGAMFCKSAKISGMSFSGRLG